MATTDLTAARVRELFEYDPETGVLRRLVSVKRNAIKAGTSPRTVSSHGYLKVKIDYSNHPVHRVIWLHYYGEWPRGVVDHINGVRTDNRIANLRDATLAMNVQNTRAARTSKASGLPLGVCRTNREPRPYRSQIRINGRLTFLGEFTTPEDAHAAYVQAKRVAHPGFML